MASKKPAITGIARPQGFIDDTLVAIGKSVKKAYGKSLKLRKPAEISVNKAPSGSKARSAAVREGAVGPKPPAIGRSGPIKISSKPKNYTETYMKGSKEYKDALKAARRNNAGLKKVNKPNPASKKRGVEYEKALQAEKALSSRNWVRELNPEGYSAASKTVRDFKYSSPRRVKKGK
jgi:hypothetical protein